VEKHVECLPALKVLDIRNCLNISSKGIEALGRHCKLLVQLKRNMPPPDLPQGFNAAAAKVVAEEEALAVTNTMLMLETARACLRPVQRRWAPPPTAALGAPSRTPALSIACVLAVASLSPPPLQQHERSASTRRATSANATSTAAATGATTARRGKPVRSGSSDSDEGHCGCLR
jgi:hypothetical protein